MPRERVFLLPPSARTYEHMEIRKKGDAVKRRICIALMLLLALAAPAALLAAEAAAQLAPSSVPAPATTSGAACAPGGLFAPAAASPLETPWDRAVELTSCDCSGFNCGPGCYPYLCVLLHGHCGAICKCNP
jgi:hypothetical protein